LGRQRRRGSKRASPAPDIMPSRFMRLRLPDGSLGKTVPVEFYPRFSTLVGNPYAQDLFDVSAFRRVSHPKGSRLTIEVVTTDDTERGWNGLPLKVRRGGAARSNPRRRTGRTASIRKQSSERGLKTPTHTRRRQGA